MARGDRSPATREALLAAGARVFVRRGPYGATVREIVHEAGFTAPALYYHFQGTEDLYVQLIRSGSERFRSLVEDALGEKSELRGTLAGIARACVRFAAEDRARLRLIYSELFGPRGSDGLNLGLDELRAWTLRRVEKVLRRAVRRRDLRIGDVPRAARLFGALLSGLLAEQARRPDDALLDERLPADVVELFLRGIAGAKVKQ